MTTTVETPASAFGSAGGAEELELDIRLHADESSRGPAIVAFSSAIVWLLVGSRRLTVETLGQQTEVPYDSLIIATGADQSYFGHPEYARHAPGMKTIDNALELRGRIFGAFEMAERESDPALRNVWLTFVVVGAGPTGVELAGQIAELAQRSLLDNFRHINPATARVMLLDAGPAILPVYPPSLQRRAAQALERKGVEIHLGAMVTGVDARGMETNATDPQLKRIEAATKIWAAGVEASPLGRMVASAAGAPVDRAGRVQVRPDCTLPGHPEVFVIGDLMSLDHLPGLAQVAIQSGHHAAKTIVRRLSGDTAERPFRYRDLGTMATISRFQAIAAIGRVQVSGFIAWCMWLVIHLVWLAGFNNRFAVLATGSSPSSGAGVRSARSQRSRSSPARRWSPSRTPSRRR